MKLRLLADVHISPRTVTELQQHGWDVIRSTSKLSPKAKDVEILKLAVREDRVMLTQDLDFSRLVALGGGARPSLVTLRLSHPDPDTVTYRLLETLPAIVEELQGGAAVTITDENIRLRRLPIT